MHHSRSVFTRALCVTCFPLAIGSGLLCLSPRGAAQENVSSTSNPDYPNATGMNDADRTNSGNSGNNPGSDGNNPGSDGNDAASNDNDGGDSGNNSNADASANPAVGVDTKGRTDATETRNGQTTRRRIPAPANPLVITNPLRITGNTLVSTSDRLTPPPAGSMPRDYTVPSDPTFYNSRQYVKPLPLFGYDFFQPARQIILARRRALLPVMPRYNRYPSRSPYRGSPNNAQSNSQSQTGQQYHSNVNSDQNSSPSNSASGSTADYALAGAAGAAAVAGRQRPNSNSTGQDMNSGNSNANDSNSLNSQDTNTQYGQDTNSQYGQDTNTQYGQDTNSQYGQDTNTQYGQDNNPSNNQDRNPQNDQGDNSQNSQYPNTQRNPSINSQYNQDGNFDNSQGMGDMPDYEQSDSDSTDTAGGPVMSRRRRVTNGDQGFPGDTMAPGNDIQFPGDDAYLPSYSGSSATNAVNGEVADPISTLYRNTLVSLPTNYQLQPGDLLTVRYSALTIPPREFSATVDSQGGISVLEVGRINVAGRTAAQAEDFLRQRLQRLYRNVDVSISLRQLRTIQVTISGAAFAPGTYTVPATATAFNVLNAAGGPTANGSMRDIRVLRNGRLAGTVDLYPLIGAVGIRPTNHNGDLNLQAGDNIYIPARLSRITIRGQVRQEAVYELRESETLRDALSFAGGIKPSGVGQTIHIDTIDVGLGRALRDVSVTNRTAIAEVPLYDGDTVEVASVRAILTNRVTILGAVQQPGDYALTPGMHLVDLIQRARGPLYNSYIDRADLTRLNPDNTTRLISVDVGKALDGSDPTQNIALAKFDRIRLYTRQEVAYIGRRQVTVRGAVQRPGLYTQSDNMKVSDLLLNAGGPLPDAYLNRAVLLHQHGDSTFAYDYVNLHAILDGSDPSQDLTIEDNDILAIYRVGEAHFTPDHTVKILGNVVAPGLYARGNDMRLSDLLKLAGAFKPGGGTRVTVAHARHPQQETPSLASPIEVALGPQDVGGMGTDMLLQDGDVVAVQGNGTIKDHPSVITVTGAVNRPGPIIISSTTRLSDAIREAGGLRPEAFPQGAEFTRTSDAMIRNSQHNLAEVISHMSDMLNLSQYQRERAKASLALIEAAGSAASGSSSGLAIPGLGGASSPAANPNVGGLVNNLSTINPVSQGRILTPSQLEPTGGVAVRLADALRHPGSPNDVLLKDGDTLVIPETPTTVQIIGAVYNNSGVVYQPGQNIDYYIEQAGDYTPDAAKDRIEVIRAGGGLIPASKAGAIEPGDLIFVPTKVLAENVSRSNGGFSAFFQGIVTSAFAYKVLTSVFGL